MLTRRLSVEKKLIDLIISMIECLNMSVSDNDCLAIYRDSDLSNEAIEGWIDVKERSGSARES